MCPSVFPSRVHQHDNWKGSQPILSNLFYPDRLNVSAVICMHETVNNSALTVELTVSCFLTVSTVVYKYFTFLENCRCWMRWICMVAPKGSLWEIPLSSYSGGRDVFNSGKSVICIVKNVYRPPVTWGEVSYQTINQHFGSPVTIGKVKAICFHQKPKLHPIADI